MSTFIIYFRLGMVKTNYRDKSIRIEFNCVPFFIGDPNEHIHYLFIYLFIYLFYLFWGGGGVLDHCNV